MIRTDNRCTYRGPVRAIVLDWAGTTIDFGSRAPALVFREVFQRQGIEITVEEARAPMGMSKRDHIRAIMQMSRVGEQWRTRLGAEPTDADVDRVYDQFLPLQKAILREHSELIPGTADTIYTCRRHGIKIGSTTGYTTELMSVVVPAATEQGYAPDVVVCCDDVPNGRPAPWMCLEAAKRMNVFPMSSVVKVDDTCVGIVAGKNAGCWTVAVAATGNEMGLTQAELESLPTGERTRRLERIRSNLVGCGAHYVIDSVAQLFSVIEDIQHRLERGDVP